MGGTFIGGGGGVSLYEPEPAYQWAVQNTGSRTVPDVSLVADPNTGAWIADLYNQSADNPWEIVGGTSLSSPAWAGLFLLANQARATAGRPTLNSASPTETQEALYNLPEGDFHDVTTGSNGFSAGVGYDLVTGLGTPLADLLVPGLGGYDGTVQSHRTVTVSGDLPKGSWAPNNWGSAAVISRFNVFNAALVFAPSLGGAAGSSHTVPEGRAPERTSPAAHTSTSAPSVPAASPTVIDLQRPSASVDGKDALTAAAPVWHRGETAPPLTSSPWIEDQPRESFATLEVGFPATAPVPVAGGLMPNPLAQEAVAPPLPEARPVALLTDPAGAPALATAREFLVAVGSFDAGAQRLQSDGGGLVLVGGDGEDLVIGGQGRDLLLGGMSAAAGDAVVISAEGSQGHTAFALRSVVDEWTADAIDISSDEFVMDL
jgi:Ca2+-binding RTX toxin-like protein